MNPFHHRGAITDASHFFGRRREIEALLARTAHATKPQCVSLVGMRRIGKSSLLRQLADVMAPELAREQRLVVVYESLEGAGNLTVARFFATLARRLSRQMRRLEVPVAARLEEGQGVDPEQAFCEWLEELCDEGLRLVVLLDEFDVVTMNPAFDAATFGRLRYLASSLPLAYVTSTYAQLSDLCHRDEIRQSPFFNIFSTANLGLLEPADAEELLLVESERAGARFTAEEVAILEDLAGTHPFHLQQAACALWESRDPADLPDVRRTFLEDAEPHLRYAVHHLSRPQREVLRAAARGTVLEPLRDPDAAFLQRRGLLRSASGRLEPFSPTFGAWLRHDDDGASGHAGGRGALASVSDETLGTSQGPSSPRVGDVLEDRWELRREIGRGGFGVVFAAFDRVLARDVAVKFLQPARARDPRARQERDRFLREARTAARITHPNVVVIHDVRERSDSVFLVMELLEGCTLRETLDRTPRLPAREAVDLMLQACEGVAAAHGMDVVHRDIKPENLVMGANGRIKVVDFGLAWLLGEARLSTESGRFMTPRYCSPEQITGAAVGKPSDVFALGCVLFEVLTGRRAYDGTSISEVIHRVLHEPPPHLEAELPDPAEALRDLLGRCLARDPAERPADAAALARELEALPSTPA